MREQRGGGGIDDARGFSRVRSREDEIRRRVRELCARRSGKRLDGRQLDLRREDETAGEDHVAPERHIVSAGIQVLRVDPQRGRAAECEAYRVAAIRRLGDRWRAPRRARPRAAW